MALNDRPPGCPAHIDAVEYGEEPWPSTEPFPLTPEECLWAMMGYAVLPAGGPITVDVWQRMAYRKWELMDGRIAPR